MYEKIRLSRILITNDDGIEAEGLQVLTDVAAELADEVWVIAPTHDQSGTALSIGLHHASRVYPRGKNRFAVSGSPADCVALSSFLMKDARPQLLLSGINVGENIGDDTNISGTLGAALTGLMLRIPSIGISQCYTGDRKTIQWDAARKHLPNLLQSLLQQGWRKETCLSINIPALPADDIEEAVWTRQAARTINGFTVAMRTDLRGGDYYWLNLTHPQSLQVTDDSDVAALRRGQISISCIGLDRSREADNENISLHPDRR
jgi:5'-nucleotidase